MLNTPRHLPLRQWLLQIAVAWTIAMFVERSPCCGQEANDTKRTKVKVTVIDQENGWPVPLVHFTTTNQIGFVTDNAGVVALDLPDRIGRETWFAVEGHGYDVEKDGFSMRGVRLPMTPGSTVTVQVQRRNIAKRIGRLTGAGLFVESQRLGERLDWKESVVTGCDSIQAARYGNKMIWFWGDTNFGNYPLGNFDMTGATTQAAPWLEPVPPLQPKYDYFLNTETKTKRMAPIPGPGPTWLSGFTVLRDQLGVEQLVATYRKIAPPMDTVEIGLCIWDPKREEFVGKKVVWRKADNQGPEPRILPEGHPIPWKDADGNPWMLFGNPFPLMKCKPSLESWLDPGQWISIAQPQSIPDMETGKPIESHSGSLAWSGYRNSYIAIFMQKLGTPSAFGEIWFSESSSPLGPWKTATKILTHDNYTFYNPRIHAEFLSDSSSVLTFEGTYTREFANRPTPTPRYDYNQVLYRLDLDDPRLPNRKP